MWYVYLSWTRSTSLICAITFAAFLLGLRMASPLKFSGEESLMPFFLLCHKIQSRNRCKLILLPSEGPFGEVGVLVLRKSQRWGTPSWAANSICVVSPILLFFVLFTGSRIIQSALIPLCRVGKVRLWCPRKFCGNFVNLPDFKCIDISLIKRNQRGRALIVDM